MKRAKSVRPAGMCVRAGVLGVVVLAAAAVASSTALAATTYYVSPTGSDGNNGTSSLTPWKTVAKVNAAAFLPGDQILFQRGGEWRESLKPASDGTALDPIVFAAYGAGAKPKFLGSDVLTAGSWTFVNGTTSTYCISAPTEVNWTFRDGGFLHSAGQKTRDQIPPRNATYDDPVLNLPYVHNNADTWWWNPTDSKLYVNTGGTNPNTDGRLYTGAVRAGLDGGAVWALKRSHLIFRDLAGSETAHWNGGYVFRTMNSVNIRFEDCDAYNGGKHHFGVINTKEFVGVNLYSTGGMPDMWSGAATATVSYSDTNNGRSGDTSQWIDCTVENYPTMFGAFYSHGGGVGDVLIQNMISRGNSIGSGPSGGTTIRVIGGLIENNSYGTSGSNTFVDGLTLTGPNAAIRVWGNNNVVQNCVLDGALPVNYQVYPGDKGAILDRGQGNIFRFNTIVLDPNTPSDSAAFCLYNADAGLDPAKNPTPKVYANIVAGSPYVFKNNFNGNGTFTWNNNLYDENGVPVFKLADGRTLNLAGWQGIGYDLASLIGDPAFAADYSLLAGSDAIDGVPLAVIAPLLDILGNPRLTGSAYDMGAYEFIPEPATLLLLSAAACGLLARRRRR